MSVTRICRLCNGQFIIFGIFNSLLNDFNHKNHLKFPYFENNTNLLNMANYDFSTLGSNDLEELVCDLLNADKKYGKNVIFKTFKDGKDKGIDFLFSTRENQFDHVGQVKHYYRTGFAGLFKDLKNKELEKVKKLIPTKYIFATSVDLLVSETEEIFHLFDPFLKSLNDIYGKSDINKLIANHETIINNHFKLWLCDTNVIKRILQSNLLFRSKDFEENELKKRVRLYVKTPIFEEAELATYQISAKEMEAYTVEKDFKTTGTPGKAFVYVEVPELQYEV